MNTESDMSKLWKDKHFKVSSKTYTGSAPNIEPFGVSAMFARYVRKRKLRYAVFIVDGDSKSYKRVCEKSVWE